MKTVMGRHRADMRGALAALLWCFCGSGASAQPATPPGIWLIDGRAAVQIFDCAGMMCGRIIFLIIPRDANGLLNRDVNNPNPQLRQRRLCGLTILWNLRPAGANRWRDGWFYNPRDGRTYRLSARLTSDDVIQARIYVATPLLGQTKRLVRIPEGTSAGWC